MLRVFLAEDESIIRETLRDTMPWARCGYTFVGEAGDGEMALPLIRDSKPDLLITDISMPFMDGLALSRLVLEEFPRMKVVIISGYDDFAYAQQAIGIGVERYLLKPITKNSLMTVLEEVREKIEEERDQRNYMAQFNAEAQEYEQYARRRFFERMVTGQLSVPQIYEQAKELGLDLRAPCYTIAFFACLPEPYEKSGAYSESSALLCDGLVAHFLKYPEYILFRYTMTTYAVLVKGSVEEMEAYMERCAAIVRREYESCAPEQSWYVATGTPTQRLSGLPACFDEVSRLWAYRYILPRENILTAQTLRFLETPCAQNSLAGLDVGKVNPSIVAGVLQSASAQEVLRFVGEYVNSMEEAIGSQPFCQYLMLNARFAATEFVRSLGVAQEDFLALLDCQDILGENVTAGDVKRYLCDVLLRAIELREKAAGRRYRSLLKQAVGYIDAHFSDAELSLNRVAKEVNISANYLSAVFSQEMGMTFVEYVSAKRMEKARELLSSTDLRSGEVAAEVGYRDPHYFSFLFKKTQGCTPRDYRAGKGKK